MVFLNCYHIISAKYRPEPQLLARISVGVFWVAAILSSLLSLERLFKDDYLDGSLEQLLLAPHPLFISVFAKVIAHWLVTGLPLILLSPIAALMLSFSADTLLVLVGTLLLGTPVLSFIGAIGSCINGFIEEGRCFSEPASSSFIYPSTYLCDRDDGSP